MAKFTVKNLTNSRIVPAYPFNAPFAPHQTREFFLPIHLAENPGVHKDLAAGLISVTSENDPNLDDAVEGVVASQVVTTSANLVAFTSDVEEGTGAEQTIAHGLGVVPNIVLLIPVAGHDGAGAAGDNFPSIVEGVHTDENIVVTVSEGAKFKVFAVA